MRASRRGFLKGGGLAAAGVALPAVGSGVSSFAEIVREPDLVQAFSGEAAGQMLHLQGAAWTGEAGVRVSCVPARGVLPVQVASPGAPLSRVLLRWKVPAPADLLVLGDAWERSYGDLQWGALVPERAMPWYFLSWDGRALHGYGVETGAGAFAFWQRDRDGISLWLDVRNGGEGVQLGGRTLAAATVRTRQSVPGEEGMAAARAFCRALCPKPRLPRGPVIGSNDWYYAYGKNTEAGILRDAALMSELAPGLRPFTVVDDGYQDPARFPDLPGLAAKITAAGARPGLWVRPLRAAPGTPATLLLPAARFGRGADSPAYDPTIPEARAKALEPVREAGAWGFELIKHDFSTYELLGQWGSAMGASPTRPGWRFHDNTHTNAEIVVDLYRGMREAAGDRLVLSCNAVGHLGAGFFEVQRTGDDVSGHAWERTRRMGVNTLGFRLPQHGVFFALDADCVPVTPDVPWRFTEQWLRAVAGSGTVLLVSPDPRSMGPEQKRAVREAFAVAAGADAVPTDWLETRTPRVWRGRGGQAEYAWLPETGADPFSG